MCPTEYACWLCDPTGGGGVALWLKRSLVTPKTIFGFPCSNIAGILLQTAYTQLTRDIVSKAFDIFSESTSHVQLLSNRYFPINTSRSPELKANSLLITLLSNHVYINKTRPSNNELPCCIMHRGKMFGRI